jgi:hypothetical protein
MDTDQGMSIALSTFSSFAGTIGIYIYDHPIYQETMKIIENVAGRLDHNGHNIRLKAVKFMMSELAKNPERQEELYADEKKLDFGMYIDLLSLDQNTAPTCEFSVDPGVTTRKFETCYDYDTCDAVIDTLGTLARFSYQLQKAQVLDRLIARIKGLKADVNCLQEGQKNLLLGYRVESLQQKVPFYRLIRFGKGIRPEVEQSGNAEELKQKLRGLIAEAENNYVREDDPGRINFRVLHNILNDEIVRPNLAEVDPAIVGEVSAELDFSKELGKQVAKCVSAEDCEKLTVDLTEDQRVNLQLKVEQIITKVTGAHAENRAMLAYLDRVAINDIRPWLKSLKDTVIAWKKWQVEYILDKKARPKDLPNISPAIAFEMLLNFQLHEYLLPFRHEYAETMQFMVRQMPQTYENSLDRTRINEAQRMLAGMTALVKATDKQFEEQALASAIMFDDKGQGVTNNGFYVSNLMLREKDLAKKFPDDFNSLFEEYNKIRDASQHFGESVLAYQAKFDETARSAQKEGPLPGAGGVERIKKYSDDIEKAKLEADADYQQYLRSTLNLVCLNYAVGQKPVKFFQTGMPKAMVDCWYGWFQFHSASGWFDYLYGNVKEFKPGTGITGLVKLSDVCGYPTDAKGEVIPPLHKTMTTNKLDQVFRNKKLTDQCNEATAQIRAELVQTGIMLVTMPLVGGLAAIPTRAAMGWVGQRALIKYGSEKMAELAIKRALGTAAFTDSLYYFGLKGGGKLGQSLFQSLATAAFFELANRSLFSTLGFMGVESFQHPEIGLSASLKTWTNSIGISTAIFMFMAPVHSVSVGVSAKVLRSVPLPNYMQYVVSEGVPFAATTAYFADGAPIVNKAWDKFWKIDNGEVHEESFFKRYMHAASLTASFKLFEGIQRKMRGQTLFEHPQHLVEMAEQARLERLGVFDKQFLSGFKYNLEKQIAEAKPGANQRFKDGDMPIVDLYATLGIKRPHPSSPTFEADLAKFKAELPVRFQIFERRYKKYIAKKSNQNPEEFLKSEFFFRYGEQAVKVLGNENARMVYDVTMANQWAPISAADVPPQSASNPGMRDRAKLKEAVKRLVPSYAM